MPKHILKNDKYRKSRGGYARLLSISCRECGSFVCMYQKDGPGALRRMYIDRMTDISIRQKGSILMCPKGDTLGMQVIYKKEKRQAYRLFVDAVVKKVKKAS